MRKVVLILCALLLVMCKSKQAAADAKTTDGAPAKTNVQYRDDFKAAPDSYRIDFLKHMKANDDEYSVVIFTRGYKGEGIQVSNEKKILYSGNIISNLKTGVGHKVRIDNTIDTKIFDSFTKKSIILESKEAKKHKFIYIMKDNANKANPFMITYSNTLRPLGKN